MTRSWTCRRRSLTTTRCATHQKYFARAATPDGKLAQRASSWSPTSRPRTAARRSSPAMSACCARACPTPKFFWDQDRKVRLRKSAAGARRHRVPRQARHRRPTRWRASQALAARDRSKSPAPTRRESRAPRALPRPICVIGDGGRVPRAAGRHGALLRAERELPRRWPTPSPIITRPSAPTTPLPEGAGLRSPWRWPTRSIALVGLLRHRREADRLEGSLRAAPRGAGRHPSDPGEQAAPRLARRPRAGLSRATALGDTPQPVIGLLMDFFADRLKVALKEQGVRHDPDRGGVRAGRRGRSGALAGAGRCAEGLRRDPDGVNLLTAYKRAANIVRIEEKKDNAATAAASIHAALVEGRRRR